MRFGANKTKAKESSLSSMTADTGMKLEDDSANDAPQAADGQGDGETVDYKDAMDTGVFTTGLLIYPTTMTIKGKGSLKLSFLAGCYAWQIKINPMDGMYAILRPVFDKKSEIIAKFLGKMSWFDLPIIR